MKLVHQSEFYWDLNPSLKNFKTVMRVPKWVIFYTVKKFGFSSNHRAANGWPKSNRNHYWKSFDFLAWVRSPGWQIFYLFFYLIWLSLSSESSQFKNFAKILSSFLIITFSWLKILFSQRVYNILAQLFELGRIRAQAESN